jgi:hypothetical protein
MDPYLESEDLWPLFHHQAVTSLYQILLPGLVDKYRARIDERQYVSEQALFTSLVRQEHREPYIEIRQRGEGRLITRVEFISPANKTTPEGRQVYLAKRDEARLRGASLVEIDLVLQGQPLFDYPQGGPPGWDYVVTVTRANQPDRPEAFPANLQKRLPRFRLPLARDDRDTLIDLHAAFARAYDQGSFAGKINYKREPPIAVSGENLAWIDGLLKQQQLR